MVFWRRNDKMSFKEIILILLILCELFSECCGKWCTVTETEYVVEKKLIKVTKYRKIAVKCNWYSMQKDCHKRVPYQDQEYVSNYVPKTVEKKVCCTGYNEELGECKPICEKACLNAKCISPNTCKCNNGYKIFSEHAPHRCIPSCSGCEFGSCVAPEVCNCASGYKRAPIYHQSKCIPYCRDECPRGSTCSQPDTCTCLPGYREIYREDKLKCLGEGETEEPPTTTTELTTTESTTTTTERTTTTTQLPTTERITTTELPTTETSTTEASNLRINNTPTSTSTSTEPESTTAKEDSTDYSEIEEVPAEDPTNSTILVQIHKAENYSSVEVVSDDPWLGEVEATTNSTRELIDRIRENRAIYSILGKLWYCLLAVVVVLCAIFATKYYLKLQTKEYKLDKENDVEVHFFASGEEYL